MRKGTSLSENAFIVVTDKENSYNVTTYNVVFNAIPIPKQFESMTSIPIVSVEASDEPQEANRARNVIEGFVVEHFANESDQL